MNARTQIIIEREAGEGSERGREGDYSIAFLSVQSLFISFASLSPPVALLRKRKESRLGGPLGARGSLSQ